MTYMDKTTNTKIENMEKIVLKTIDHLLQSDCKKKPIAWLQVLYLTLQDLKKDIGQNIDHIAPSDNI